MCVNYFIGLFHLSLEQLLSGLDQVLPDQALAVMQDYLAYASLNQSPAIVAAALVVALVVALVATPVVKTWPFGSRRWMYPRTAAACTTTPSPAWADWPSSWASCSASCSFWT